jgi:outer membrane PBP1 activator LpoA protein
LHFPWARAPQALPGTLARRARTFLHRAPCGGGSDCLAGSPPRTIRAPRPLCTLIGFFPARQRHRPLVGDGARHPGKLRRNGGGTRRRQLGQQQRQGTREQRRVALFRLRRTTDHHGDLAAREIGLAGREPAQLCHAAAVHGLVELGQFARHHHGSIGAEGLLDFGEGVDDAMRRLEQHDGARLLREARERRTPFGGTRGQEAFEDEAIGGQRRHGQRRGDRRGPGDAAHRHAGRRRRAHQEEPRVGDERRAGIAHQREARAAAQAFDQWLDARRLVVVVERLERAGNPAGGEQAPGMARVFGEHQLGRFQARAGARAQVVNIADRRRNDIQSADRSCHYNLRMHSHIAPVRRVRAQSIACIAAALAALLAGCASFPPASFPEAQGGGAPGGAHPGGGTAAAPAELEAAAARSSGGNRVDLQLDAARAWLNAARSGEALRVLQHLGGGLTPVQQVARQVLEADIELAAGHAQRAWQLMGAIQAPAGTPAEAQYYESRTRIALAAARPVDAVRAEMAAERIAGGDGERSRLRAGLLAQLRTARAQGVKLEAAASNDPVVRGWLELGAIAGASGGVSISGGADAQRWRASYPAHPATELLAQALPGAMPLAGRLRHVALILPLSGAAGSYAGVVRSGFEFALQQLPAEARPEVQAYDTGALPVDQALRQARADGNDFAVGPLTRQEVEVAAGAAAGLPLLALNFLSVDRTAPPGMAQFALSPEDEARAVARRLLAAGQKHGAALAPASDWGSRVLAAFTQELQAGGGALTAQASYDPAGHDYGAPIREVLATDQSYARRRNLELLLGQRFEFEPRARADLDFIFAPGQPVNARLVRQQLRFQYAGNVPVYSTSDAYAPDGGVSNQDLEGMVLPSMPWLVPGEGSTAALRSTAEAAAGDSTEWQSGLYAFGYDACQLALALAAAGGDPRRVHVAGLTGDLTVGGDGRVHREPYWARINRNGEPKPVGVPANLPSGAPTP